MNDDQAIMQNHVRRPRQARCNAVASPADCRPSGAESPPPPAIPNAALRPSWRGLLWILLALGQARSAWLLRAVPMVESGLERRRMQAA